MLTIKSKSPVFKTVLLAMGLLVQEVNASTPSISEPIQLTHCLASYLPDNYSVLAEDNQYKIIDIPSHKLQDLALLADQMNCGRFVNLSPSITGKDLETKKKLAEKSLKAPSKSITSIQAGDYILQHEHKVNPLLAQVDPNYILSTLTHLTNYHNRFSRSQTGVDAVNWIQNTVEGLAKTSNRQDVKTYLVDTGSYKQPSLVTVIGENFDKPAVVLGAHIDTLSGRMPGAGDDGSGSAGLMEVARVLFSSQTTFDSPVYLIWYAAEEMGLVGSQYVVKHFKAKKIPVKAAIQFDMIGYRNDSKDSTMWVFRDYTDKSLSNFVATLISSYIKAPVKYSYCGYGCSDHASWNKAGIPVAFPCETNFEDHNPHIHSSKDTIDRLNIDHMANFTKLGLAFAVELASA